MPTYQYLCTHCNVPFEAREPVANRHATDCPDCGYLADRVFAPTVHLIVPAHFRVEANWMLPEDTAGWEAQGGNGSQTHAVKEKTFKQTFDEEWKRQGGA